MPDDPVSSDQLHPILFRFIDLLDASAIPSMIVGALAVAVWGRPRGTAIIDLAIRGDAAGLERLTRDASSAGFLVDEEWLDANPLLRGMHLRLLAGGIVLDAMRPRDRHDEAAFARRRPIEFSGRALWFVAPEDLIVMKLKAGRPRDFADALGVLAAQRAALDEPYLIESARVTGVGDELAYLMSEGTAPS